MAGIRVVVCLPAQAADNVEAAIADVLAPFERDSGIEWREIWDSWTIRGGSETTGFSVLPGFEGDPKLIHDSPRYDGKPMPSLLGKCAGGPRGMLDLSTLHEWMPDLLTLDGWWIEDGDPVHGTCDGSEVCPHMQDGLRYAEDPVGYLEGLASDVILIRLRCHG
ncbi:hypothetical protein FBY35_0123 [Streptomyces sp. SLBN-118]|uniref:hypothetical protein n=1 Tax=Streptomyces sp. SLBN-118 TaxID=2768454 RepID=UPI00114D6C0A|nr:hypothetical protein [Streptomyces sp. SLBN-118]TQK49849.1 hypothetical protein FBY35_0123 [Streptomyces sp. SLBN-118]